MDAKIYNQSGKETGKVTLPERVFSAKWNADLVHQVVLAMQANARTMVAHTKDRSEVAGTGKKPYKQKGTGRARHGSRRSPIWVGGGIAHGPRNDKNYKQKINKKMKVSALYSALSNKIKDGEVMFVDKLVFDTTKTADAKKVLEGLSGVEGFEMILKKRNNSALIVTTTKSDDVYRSFGNFGNVAIEEVRNLNPLDVLNYKYLVIVEPEASVEFLESKSKDKLQEVKQEAK